MASTDAKPFPIKNAAYRVTFPIMDADGDLVTGATGLDSEVSKDGGAFADCTNEATEIATSSGMYYLDLTSTEMNADTVAVIVKTSSSGAKTTPIVMYPQEAGDVQVNVTYWNGTAVATPDTAGYPKVTLKTGTGAGELSVTSGVANVNATQLSGDATAADNAEAFFDGTGYAGTNNVMPTVTTVTNMVSANVTQLSGDATAADNAEAFFDGTGYAGTNNVIPTVTTVNGLSNATIDAILDEVVEGSTTMRQMLRIMFAALAGKSDGGGTAEITFRDIADSKDRITATIDANRNRTAIVLDGS